MGRDKVSGKTNYLNQETNKQPVIGTPLNKDLFNAITTTDTHTDSKSIEESKNSKSDFMNFMNDSKNEKIHGNPISVLKILLDEGHKWDDFKDEFLFLFKEPEKGSAIKSAKYGRYMHHRLDDKRMTDAISKPLMDIFKHETVEKRREIELELLEKLISPEIAQEYKEEFENYVLDND